MDIYIKPVKKTILTERGAITVGDVAEVVADDAERINRLTLTLIQTSVRRKNFLIKCTDIIRAVAAAHPDAHVINVGEKDTVVMYSAKPKKESGPFLWIKVAMVTLLLLTGSASAIMSFHTDAQIPKVFENYYKIFYGKKETNPLIITIPYSIGLAVGIIVFYNHAFGRKLSDDPTPLEVEMSNYENEVTDTVRDALNT